LGGPFIFFTRPISVVLLVLAVILAVVSVRFFRRIPEEVRMEEQD
jgi:TctA family transporter